ncbi:MAG: hypothetical protein M3040_13650 [Bacteroidota bacterium]|nr:hypothetical protein [Bacteroidota bacterium]
MIEWNYLVIGLSLLLLLFLLFKEVKRPNKARLTGRVLSTIFAVLSLACIALPITYHSTQSIAINHEAVLLTDGFNRDSVKRFLSSRSNDIPVVKMEKDLKDAAALNALYVPHARFLTQRYPDINTFHVFGFGLEKNELDFLKNVSVVFHPAAPLSGITSINWNHKILSGQKLFIQGSFSNATSVKAKLVLSSFDATIDSLFVPVGIHQKFELTAIPISRGRAVYAITAMAAKDTLEKEVVPVQVEQGEPLKVLLLSSSPDFETRFLKDLLSQQGFKVVSRTTISKNKFVKDFLNTTAFPVEHITAAVLDKFDVAIVDAGELKSMQRSELVALQTQVARKSMGLIVRADSSAAGSFYASMFPLIAGENNPVPLHLSFSDSTGNMPLITTGNLLFIRDHPGTLTLVTDAKSRSVASMSLYGSGKIIVTTLTNTYSWALSGFQSDYYSFWSRLLNKATVKSAASEAWSLLPALPQINQPVQLQVQTNSADNPKAQVGVTSVYMAQDEYLPYQWSGTYYPVKAGWQTGIELNGDPFFWFAYDKNDWKNIRAAEKIADMRKHIQDNTHALAKVENKVKTLESEIPKAIFLATFLLFAGYLWLENKM